MHLHMSQSSKCSAAGAPGEVTELQLQLAEAMRAIRWQKEYTGLTQH